jgi:hypothetical protein
MKRKITIGAVAFIVAVVGVVAAIYAFTFAQEQRQTGIFTIDLVEQVDISVTTYGMAVGAGPSAAWCEGALDFGPLRCVLRVRNETQTNAVNTRLAIVDAIGTLNLPAELAVAIHRTTQDGSVARDGCRDGSMNGGFALAASGTLASIPAVNFVLDRGDGGGSFPAAHFCFVLTYAGTGVGVGQPTASATIKIDASDGPLP